MHGSRIDRTAAQSTSRLGRRKAAAARHSAPTNCTVAASATPMTRPPTTAPERSLSAEDRSGEQRQEQVEPHEGTDLDEDTRHRAR